MPASLVATTTRAVPAGRSKLSVNSDEPLIVSASVRGCTPLPQKTPVKPITTSATHIAGRQNSPTGAYIARTRSHKSMQSLR